METKISRIMKIEINFNPKFKISAITHNGYRFFGRRSRGEGKP